MRKLSYLWHVKLSLAPCSLLFVLSSHHSLDFNFRSSQVRRVRRRFYVFNFSIFGSSQQSYQLNIQIVNSGLFCRPLQLLYSRSNIANQLPIWHEWNEI